jgi:hypothetical protein
MGREDRSVDDDDDDDDDDTVVHKKEEETRGRITRVLARKVANISEISLWRGYEDLDSGFKFWIACPRPSSSVKFHRYIYLISNHEINDTLVIWPDQQIDAFPDV